MTPKEYLESFYEQSMTIVGSDDFIKSNLPANIKFSLDGILNKSEAAKGVITVVITSIVYKIFNPAQDIRKHQNSIEGGYSGRSFDNKYITPLSTRQKI